MSGPVVSVAELGRVHLVGVGGAGMSAVAVLLAARGVVVSGCDAQDGAVLRAVAAAGIPVTVGHTVEHVDEVDTLVVSSAVRAEHSELVAARGRGRRVLHRSEALAALMHDRTAVAVAGAHGKTTTATMLATILTAVGMDPSFAIGGTVGGLVGGRHGDGPVFVAEADESDGSFLAYSPTVAVVTNVEPDHLDHYGSRAALEAAFEEFARRVRPGGRLVVCADDDGARRLADRARSIGVQVVTYGTSPGSDVILGPWTPAGGGGTLTVQESGEHPVLVQLSVPGAHNGSNAAAAWTAARALGVDPVQAAQALADHVGPGRRFEARGSAAGVQVIDDYAHHPTEVAAVVSAAREVAGEGRVLVLFQPHLFSRTATFAAEFADALGGADLVVVTDVYAAREDPDPDVTGALITDRMGTSAEFVADRVAAAQRIGRSARPGDVVLTVGAGDVTELAPVVLAAVGAPEVGL